MGINVKKIGLILAIGLSSYSAQATEIIYRGDYYAPAYTVVLPQSPSLSPAPQALYTGQKMYSKRSGLTGTLTGNMLVRTENLATLAQLNAQKTTSIDDEYVLLFFDIDTNLYDKLQQALALAGVKNAELEISTLSLEPR